MRSHQQPASSATAAASSPSTGKDRFICVNLLPPDTGNSTANLAILQEQIDAARAAGFTHAWINPIGIVDKKAVCHRTDLDTGITTDLYGSLYAPIDPSHIRDDLPCREVRAILQRARSSNFHVLVDFVWKHISKESDLAKKPGWAGKTFSDITEYNFEGQASEKIYRHLEKTIDTLLNPDTGYGFSGLRIDAASHIKASIRDKLYSYIRENYPAAIIMEECLFDSKEAANISDLVKNAEPKHLYSDFITSNLYYQQPDVFGALPLPNAMGDSEKLKLAHQNGISFTGNHDHFSAGWSVILSMAAERASQHSDFINTVSDSTNVSPFTNDDTQNKIFADLVSKMIKTDSNTKPTLPENFSLEEQKCIRFLLPFANEIARELLDTSHSNHKDLLEKFRAMLFTRIANRTMPSMSGYFMLFSELVSPFATPRIFSSNSGRSLPQVLLTIADLKENMELTKCIVAKMKTEVKPEASEPEENNKTSAKPARAAAAKVPAKAAAKVKPKAAVKKDKKASKKYDNLTNFEKGRDLSKPKALDDNALRSWLPYIVEYLRNHPEENKYPKLNPANISSQDQRLQQELGTPEFIHSINTIFAGLTTTRCNDYYTFSTSDNCNITIRCNEDSTDIIILNLNHDKMVTINDLDLQKIALYLQTRKFPISEACGNTGAPALSAPFSATNIVYPPDGYLGYWQGRVGDAFGDAYNRVVGTKPDHRTNLYLGTGIKSDISSQHISIRVHVQTKQEAASEIFHDTTTPLVLTSPRSHATPNKGYK